MISAGLTTISSCYDLQKALLGNQTMKILCIGHGGGSLPLFLASKIRGAIVHIVEIDPIVISASTQAMGFPSSSVITQSGIRPKPDPIDELLWKGTHERLFLFNSDAEKFILDSHDTYDLVFIDAYDGQGIFPHKLWDPHSPFLQALSNRLHPVHGTVVVNLYSDDDTSSFTLGLNVSRVCHSYKDVLLEKGNLTSGSYTVSVPWARKRSLVVCRCLGRRPEGEGLGWDFVSSCMIGKANEVEKLLSMPFSCGRYIRYFFTPVE